MDEVRDIREKNWYFVNTTVILDYGHILKPIGIAVYNVLAARADNHNQDCYPSQKSIAETIGASQSAVWRAIKQLEELGLIRIDSQFRQDGGRSSNIYTLLQPPEYQPPSSEGRPPQIGETITPSSEGRTNYPQEESSSFEPETAPASSAFSGMTITEIYYRDKEKVTTSGRVYDPPWYATCPACEAEIKVMVLDRATECSCALGAVLLLSRRNQPQIMIPEPLLIYQRLTNRKVPAAWQEQVVKVVGNDTDFWQDVVKAYIGVGWNSGNVANMLKYFTNRQLPGARADTPQEPVPEEIPGTVLVGNRRLKLVDELPINEGWRQAGG